MMVLAAHQLADALRAAGHPVDLHADLNTCLGPDVVIDSRLATPGAIFVALPGERVDGHDYADAAAANGAALALVTRPVNVPYLQTDDAQQALTTLARYVVSRARDGGMTTFAITGSSGKTSTKDLLASICRASEPTVSPRGSFNNELGTPLTACQVTETTRYLISEMGTRALGDITYLCSIVQPDIAIVTNVGTAHIGEFGSQTQIARAKAEIIEALPTSGWAVLNADDPFVEPMASVTRAHVARYATTPITGGDLVVYADEIVPDHLMRHSFDLFVNGDLAGRVQLRSIGDHQVSNALAAATAALAAGMEIAVIVDALNAAVPESAMRMEVVELASGATIINDAYNANPDSMAAALRSVAAMKAERRIAVLGDMLELGDDAPSYHRDVGEVAGRLLFDQVYCIGDHAADLARGVKAGGATAVVSTVEDVTGELQLRSGDIVLVKASRGLRLERIVEQWLKEDDR